MVLGIDHRSTRTLFDNFREFLTPINEKLNNTLKIEGLGQDVELDEISFRSKIVGNRVVWIRYLAIVRRGSSKIWISQLPYRITEGGQGGGGPISLEELKAAILPEDNPPRLAEGSICHTDGARIYKQLGSMDSPLLESDVFHSEFASLRLAHTAAKYKLPKPQFVKIFKLKKWDGSNWVQDERLGGTQKLDGFFASFWREVGRRPFNTTGPSLESAAKMEQHSRQRMRCFQLAYWLSGSDLFQVFGALHATERSAEASWEILSPFVQDRATSSAMNAAQADADAVVDCASDSDQALSELYSDDDV